MAVVEARVSLWEALAGRAPGRPTGPSDRGLWTAVVERLNPARARPRLRPGIEEASLVSARGGAYVMLRSPDAAASYLRLSPEELALARLMDGERTLARLVAEFARISGRLAPDQVRRVVADLAGNRMLAELPVDAFRPLASVRRPPWPVRLGRALLAAARGRRMLVVDVDRLVGLLYRAGGRFLFNPVAVVLLALVTLAGLGAFGWTWWQGADSLFLSGGSYPAGAAVLLGLNVVALACHELGHGLAAKHAGRRVPAAGVLVYFGIPSVFVDTTDVWMAGRRARLRTTAAGPAAGLALAGVAGLVGLAVPELSPWTFKLAFLWYLNALFNLNPFLALDGYYLLMDWLEVPNLRARGLAWIRARLRPRWRELDGEGRLIALYGVVAVLWLAIAANLAYRVYADRVSGLVTGVWRAGWPGRLLLAVVVAGLAAPLVYAAAGWAGGRWRALARWWAGRRLAVDLPRRREVLRSSPLAALPAGQLDQLAGQARWLHPGSGTALVRAGAAQREVLVVAEGAVEGRRPGDPGGTVRQRVGPGGVVGLAAALAGAPASLSWHTAGTTLLALPAPVVAATVGGSAGVMADRAEAESVFAECPGLAGLDEEERAALATRAYPVSVPPGSPVPAPAPHEAMVVASGVVVQSDGTELRRGSVLLPPASHRPPAATARAWVRLWLVPVVAAAAVSGAAAGRAPRYGVHPPAAYPPLAVPPGPPPAGLDGTRDRWFERRLRWLVLLLLLLALLLSGSHLLAGPAWSEMPEDRVLLTVTRGLVETTVDGEPERLRPGGRIYLAAGDRVAVGAGSLGRLTLHGGSVVLLCAGSDLTVGPVGSDGVRPIAPAGELHLSAGTVLLDTASPSTVFVPAVLAVHTGGRTVVNRGEAWYAVDRAGARVAVGEVAVDGVPVRPTSAALTCGDGVPVGRPVGSPEGLAAGVPGPSTGPSTSGSVPPTAGPGSPSPGTGSPSPAPSGAGSPPASGGPASPEPTGPGPVPTSGGPPPSPGPTTTATTSPPPPPNRPPTIQWVEASGTELTLTIRGAPCTPNAPAILTYFAGVVDEDPASLTVTLSFSGVMVGSEAMVLRDGQFVGTIGPIPWEEHGDLRGGVKVAVRAEDAHGLAAQLDGPPFTLIGCPLVG
jgi:putative peptide zinc metalloprotease protein